MGPLPQANANYKTEIPAAGAVRGVTARREAPACPEAEIGWKAFCRKSALTESEESRRSEVIAEGIGGAEVIKAV